MADDIKDMAGNLINSSPLMMGFNAARAGGQKVIDIYNQAKSALTPSTPATPQHPITSAMQYYIDRMGLARLHLQSQMPKESAGVRSVSPMTGFEQGLLGPNTQAATLPGGIIRYNPTNLPADQDSMDDVLAHEYVHIGQQQQHGGILSDIYHTMTQDADYNERPDEKAAYDYEKKRQSKRKDINLSKGKRK